jgi:glycosyltransferase involved in cell wall biosynthesis
MVRAAAAAVAERGWTPEVALPADAGERDWIGLLHEDGIRVHLAGDTSRLGSTRWLGNLLAGTDEPTLLHSSFTTFDVASARVGRRRPATSSLWHCHSPILPGPGRGTRARIKFSLVGRPVDRVLCCSTQVRDQVLRFGARESRVRVLLNAIETARFPDPTAGQRLAARKELGLDPEAEVLLHFGWDWHFKGGDVFLAASAELLEQADERLIPVIVGGGDAALRIARELGIEDRVRLLEPVSEVQKLYAAADVFVAPARLEGMPFALLEALASGVPVVASTIPGHQLTEGTLGGYVQTPLEPAAVAAGVRQVLTARAAGDQGMTEARDWVRANLDVRPWAQRLAADYESLLGVPSSGNAAATAAGGSAG